MSITNIIKMLLDIQDENIHFEDNCVTEGIFKEKTCKFVTGKLTYKPTHCRECGVKNEDYIIYKNGTQTSRITLPIAGVYPTYLYLKKQRIIPHRIQILSPIWWPTARGKIVEEMF